MKSKKQKALVSLNKDHDLYFLVAVSPYTGKIIRILLPTPDKEKALSEISKFYPDYKLTEEYEDLLRELTKIYHGEDTKLELELLELNSADPKSPIKTEFMENVLLETCKIPLGKVGTYKSLAQKLNTHAYRAVGTALARNPFPLIIPCHRIIRSDYTIGNYGGGTKMKKKLLIREGIKIKDNKVVNMK